MIAIIGALCPLAGILLAVAVLYGCEGRIGTQQPTKVHLDPPSPPLAVGSPNPVTEVSG